MEKPTKSKNSLGAVLFGLPFFAAGVGVLWFMVLGPMSDGKASSGWPKAACEVTHSQLKSSSDGDTYRADIRTSYVYEGRQYNNGSFDLTSNSSYSSGKASKRKVLKQYPVGWQGDCYVNPEDPSRAIIKPGIPVQTWVMLPFGGVFAMVGLFVMSAGLGLFSNNVPRSNEESYNSEDVTSNVLKPSIGPKGAVAVSGFIALFWNGIVSVFVTVLFFDWRDGGDIPWFVFLFMLPFIAVGAYLLVNLFKAILASFNPQPVLTLDKRSPRLGERITLKWGLLGNKERIQSLIMMLEGREKATYRVGTDTTTDTHVIYSQEIVSTDLIGVAELNATDFLIPADSMHSFEANNNEIEWVIKVDGVIDRWPDIEYEYPVWVRP